MTIMTNDSVMIGMESKTGNIADRVIYYIIINYYIIDEEFQNSLVRDMRLSFVMFVMN